LVGGHTATVTAKDPAKAARCACCAPSPPVRLTLVRHPIHPPLVCHHPHLSAALHQVLQTAGYSITTDLLDARGHCYGTTAAMPQPADDPARPANRWLTLPALSRVHREVAGHGSDVRGVRGTRPGRWLLTSVKIIGLRAASWFVRSKPYSTGARTADKALSDNLWLRVSSRLRAAL
jgi:hypothetical protein